MARLTLTPTLLAATAGCRSSLGTRSGVIACQPGAVNAPPAATRKVKISNTGAVTSFSQTRTANTAEMAVMALSPHARSLRLSRLSVRAPAGMANRNSGRLVATWTSETMSGEGLSSVISQPQADEYIQVPMFDTRVAVQITANARWPKGAKGEGAPGPRLERSPAAFKGLNRRWAIR